jgi:uncharacterized phiE125 gp8 family phage protein
MTDYALHLLTPPASEPVTLDEALTQCHADAGVEDAWFLSRIRAGREKVETYVKLSLMPQTWVLTATGNIPRVVDLPRPPLLELVSVQTASDKFAPWVDVDLDDVAVFKESAPAQISIKADISAIGILRIEYRAGHETPERIPSPLKDAILLYVSHSYENRAGEADIPKAFYDLIEPYRLHIWVDGSD